MYNAAPCQSPEADLRLPRSSFHRLQLLSGEWRSLLSQIMFLVFGCDITDAVFASPPTIQGERSMAPRCVPRNIRCSKTIQPILHQLNPRKTPKHTDRTLSDCL